MNKFKAFFKKKPVLIAAAIAAMVTLFFFLLRGNKATSSGGITQLTPQSNGNGTSDGSILSAVKDMLSSFKQNNDQQLADLKQSQQDTVTGLQGTIAALAQQIQQQAAPAAPVSSGSSGGIVTPAVLSNSGYTPPQPVNPYSVGNFLANARSAIDNASQNYFANAGNDSQQSFYHGQAEQTRQSVMQFFSNKPGYSVKTQDSGGGYSNVVVTAPDGSIQIL